MRYINIIVIVLSVFMLVSCTYYSKDDLTDVENVLNPKDNNENIENNEFENFFLTNIPYDKSIIYKTNLNANLSNDNGVTSDESYIYYINIKDDDKLYKMNKSQNISEKIFDESVSNIYLYDKKIYFIQYDNTENENSLICKSSISCVSTNGVSKNVIIEKNNILCFVIHENNIYYIAHSNELNEKGLERFDLYKYNLLINENTLIYKNVCSSLYAPISIKIMLNNEKIYFFDFDFNYIEYNTVKMQFKTMIENNYYKNLTVYNGYIYYHDKNSSISNSKWNISRKKLDCSDTSSEIFSEFDSDDMLMNMNVTDNYIFIIYATKHEINNGSNLFVLRMKHDGSELVKIYEIPCKSIGNISLGFIYTVDDKIIIFNRKTIEKNDNIIVLDFDGNRLDWDI